MTLGIIILTIVTLLVLLLPAWPAFAEWRTGIDKHPLTISDTYADDHHVVARAFGKEVAEHLQTAVQSFLASGGQPGLGRVVLKEHYEVIGPHDDTTPDFENGVLPLVLVRNTLTQWPADRPLTRQTYVSGAFESQSSARIDRLFVDGEVRLGEETVTESWLHAERHIRALAGCQLNGSVEAGGFMQIWPACHFERLAATEIRFGDEWHWPEAHVPSRHTRHELPPLFRLNGRASRQGNVHQVDGNLTIPAGHVWTGDLIVRGKLRLAREARVEGSIKAEGDILFDRGSSVIGHAFSSSSIEVREGACIQGTVAAEDTLRVRWGAEIGTHEAPATATGTHVLMEQGSRVFGVVMAVESGRVALRTVARIAA
ncbi:MAG: hypothetical protein HKN29_13570 [Rhodothermales bacterium]|nr:hypothetical protein [Rhodothermales bacterium]